MCQLVAVERFKVFIFISFDTNMIKRQLLLIVKLNPHTRPRTHINTSRRTCITVKYQNFKVDRAELTLLLEIHEFSPFTEPLAGD